MSNQDIQRRRDLLTQRLVEQTKTFNKNLLKQNLNIAFFICIILPLLVVGFGLLIYLIFQNLGNGGYANINSLLAWIPNILKTNKYVSLIVIIIFVSLITGVTIFHFSFHISFTSDELKLAGYILAVTHKNGIVNYQNLHKEVEFRSLTFNDFDKVVNNLTRLSHIHINDNVNPELKVIIRDSDW